MAKNEMKYVVRKTWEDVESQVGLDYNFFVNAKKACDKLEDYKVFDNNGKQVYPEMTVKKEEPLKSVITSIDEHLEIGDVIVLKSGVTNYLDGRRISSAVLNEKLYIIGVSPKSYKLSRIYQGSYIGEVLKT